MSYKNNNKSSVITFEEALETFVSLADLETAVEEQIPEDIHLETPEKTEKAQKTVEWFMAHDLDENVKMARDMFKVVLAHMQEEFKVSRDPAARDQAVARVKDLMEVVKSGTNTLIKMTEEEPIVELEEFKEIQKLYRKRVARRLETDTLSRWVFGLSTLGASEQTLEGRLTKRTEHIYVDLDAVKKDTEYELFFLRKEEGGRFFNPSLIRNMYVVCDLGDSQQETEAQDPLFEIHEWHDKQMRSTAITILDYIYPVARRLFKDTSHCKKKEFPSYVYRAIMALMMSSNAQNYYHDDNSKSCFDYFADFLYFLRCGLGTREYQKLMITSPCSDPGATALLFEILHSMCHALFLKAEGELELVFLIKELGEKAMEQVPEKQIEAIKTISDHLALQDAALRKIMRRHPNGHLMKILEVLKSGSNSSFDPLWQYSVPCQLYSLYTTEHQMQNIRIPSPTHQEVVSKARVVEEFKSYLASLSDGVSSQHHLVINLQDRTSWREHARCAALEQMVEQSEGRGQLTVVTLAKDTDFYRQEAPYDIDHHADTFIQNFREQLEDDKCGFYFPEEMQEELFPQFVHQLLDSVHRTFFEERNVLNVEERRNFIEITYLFLQLKILDIVRPDAFSLVCKDGVDISSPSNGLLFLFMKLLNQDEITESGLDQLNVMLYSQSFLLRERVIIKKRISRMIDALRTIEECRDQVGGDQFKKIINEAFGSLYNTSILDGVVVGLK